MYGNIIAVDEGDDGGRDGRSKRAPFGGRDLAARVRSGWISAYSLDIFEMFGATISILKRSTTYHPD